MPILRSGFGYVRADASGKPVIMRRNAAGAGRASPKTMEPRSARTAWRNNAGTRRSPRRSRSAVVAAWLEQIKARTRISARPRQACAAFFLADPEELSLVALVDEFASDEPAMNAMYRIEGGNDRLATALAAPFGDRLQLNTELVAVSHRGSDGPRLGAAAGVRRRRSRAITS